MLAGVQGGGDVQALQQILAGQQVMSTDVGALFTAVVQRLDTLKIIDSPAAVFSVALSPDGTRIVSGGEDGVIRVWDAATGQPVGSSLTGQSGAVLSVAFSPDGHRIFSGSWDNTVRVWDAATVQPVGSPLTSSYSA